LVRDSNIRPDVGPVLHSFPPSATGHGIALWSAGAPRCEDHRVVIVVGIGLDSMPARRLPTRPIIVDEAGSDPDPRSGCPHLRRVILFIQKLLEGDGPQVLVGVVSVVCGPSHQDHQGSFVETAGNEAARRFRPTKHCREFCRTDNFGEGLVRQPVVQSDRDQVGKDARKIDQIVVRGALVGEHSNAGAGPEAQLFKLMGEAQRTTPGLAEAEPTEAGRLALLLHD